MARLLSPSEMQAVSSGRRPVLESNWDRGYLAAVLDCSRTAAP